MADLALILMSAVTPWAVALIPAARRDPMWPIRCAFLSIVWPMLVAMALWSR